jgi:hypothetical protein
MSGDNRPTWDRIAFQRWAYSCPSANCRSRFVTECDTSVRFGDVVMLMVDIARVKALGMVAWDTSGLP